MVVKEELFPGDTAVGKYIEIKSIAFQVVGVFHGPAVDLSVALYTLLALVVTGALPGLIPATRAIKIWPVEALRYEM
jgi:ABC-type lipoprotein release transport system permease subunit